MSTRIERRFEALSKQGRAALVTFLTAGDPDLNTALDILMGLPDAGADIIEIGVPFSDPMADGPSIQASSLRAIRKGMTLSKTLDAVQAFRKHDDDTPIVLMGYYNPIYSRGTKQFLSDAKEAGVDGLIVVDLPPEEEGELCIPAIEAGLNFIYLIAPTTDDVRLPRVIQNASGFIYFVSIAGITGTKSANKTDVASHVRRIKSHSNLPVAVGFGIRTPKQAAEIAQFADGVVVGSALVDIISENLNSNGDPVSGTTEKVFQLVSELSGAVKGVHSLS